jgi:hypothetical protein
MFLRYVIALFLVASAAAITWLKRSGFRIREVGRALLAIAVFYLFTVFVDDYHQYQRFGAPYAINGRYLLPALPILCVPMLSNLQLAWRRLASKSGATRR